MGTSLSRVASRGRVDFKLTSKPSLSSTLSQAMAMSQLMSGGDKGSNNPLNKLSSQFQQDRGAQRVSKEERLTRSFPPPPL